MTVQNIFPRHVAIAFYAPFLTHELRTLTPSFRSPRELYGYLRIQQQQRRDSRCSCQHRQRATTLNVGLVRRDFHAECNVTLVGNGSFDFLLCRYSGVCPSLVGLPLEKPFLIF
jgi:hypothetical protein